MQLLLAGLAFLASAESFWIYRSPKTAWRPSWSFPQPEDLSPTGLRRLSRRARGSAVFFLLMGIAWSVLAFGAISDDDGNEADHVDTDHELCVERERGMPGRDRDGPYSRTPEEICEVLYPDN